MYSNPESGSGHIPGTHLPEISSEASTQGGPARDDQGAVSLDTASGAGPVEYEVVDEPFKDPTVLHEGVLLIRVLDRLAALTKADILDNIPLPKPGEEIDPELLKTIPNDGLTAGHTLPELVRAAKTRGAEFLELIRLIDNQPVGYMTYFTKDTPPHFANLATEVKKHMGADHRMALVDTVVNLDPKCKGGYTFMMAQLILECREKCLADGIDRGYSMVRVYPNPNTALKAHAKLGWKPLKDADGNNVIINETCCPEAFGESVQGKFMIVYFEFNSPEADLVVEKAKKLRNFRFEDLDGARREFP